MLFIWQTIPVVRALYSSTDAFSPLARFVGFTVGVGICEELCKAAPLLLFALNRRRINSAGDGLFLGMMSGLGFAASEGVVYTIKYWSAATGLGATTIRDCLERASASYGSVDQETFLNRLGDVMPGLFEQYGHLVVAQLVRFISLPLLHAVWSGIVGYALARAFLERAWWLFFAGLFASALLHGMYNFSTPTIYSLAVAAASVTAASFLLVRVTHSEVVP